ncbi:cell wall surface anchor family protein [Rhodotorula toruloides]|uniref:Cell wall surface anchor family protein n=1 Tax=Rhodotorula toruloides TaxID=5286 RepID=A0A511KMN4_RHOTO|nr:cell wall surface anchor family protein [Rhodotorula toruloides]
MPTHWLFVGNIPLTPAERYIYDTPNARGIRAEDVFMSRKPSNGRRFAYVGVYSLRDADGAITALDGTWVYNVRLLGAPFCDPGTDASIPRLAAGTHVLRRYIGPQRQADRPRHLRHTGVFLLHLQPATTQEEVLRFVRPDVPPETIKYIKLRTLGLSTLAFVDTDDENACRRDILNLDGRILRRVAVRVAWQELAEIVVEARQIQYVLDAWTFMENSRPPKAAEGSLPPAKRRRLSTGGGPFDTKIPPAEIDRSNPSLEDRPASSPSMSRNISDRSTRPDAADDHRESTSSATQTTAEATLWVNEPTSAGSATSSLKVIDTLPDRADDSSRLRSLGLPGNDFIERIWASSNESTSSSDRSVDVNASFSFTTAADAHAALEANRLSPAFPDDELMQRQYEIFLLSQARLDKDWYMGFLSQLIDTYRSTDLSVSTVRQSSRQERLV